MIDIVMVGSGGCMRELVWQILEDNKYPDRWNITGYIDNEIPKTGEGLCVGRSHVPYLGDDDYLLKSRRDINVVVSVGSSALRAKLARRYLANPHLHFPNIILGSTCLCDDLEIGQGCIITMDARVSTNVKIGDFVFMNTGSMVCHDSVIRNYVTLGPGSRVAGAVMIGEGTELGMNAAVIQCLDIGSHVMVGAGAVVIRNVEDGCTVVGVPAGKVR